VLSRQLALDCAQALAHHGRTFLRIQRAYSPTLKLYTAGSWHSRPSMQEGSGALKAGQPCKRQDACRTPGETAPQGRQGRPGRVGGGGAPPPTTRQQDASRTPGKAGPQARPGSSVTGREARLTTRQPPRQQDASRMSRKMVPMASAEQDARAHRLEPRLGQQLGRLSASPQQQLAAAPAASAVTQEPSVQQQRGCARARACVVPANGVSRAAATGHARRPPEQPWPINTLPPRRRRHLERPWQYCREGY